MRNNTGTILARQGVRDIQEREGIVPALGALLSSDSVVLANDAGALQEWVQAQTPSSRRQSLVDALVEDNTACATDWEDNRGAIRDIENGVHVVVVSHQPTNLAYTGVYAQFFLAQYLVESLRATGSQRAVGVYLCLDADDAYDRRIRTAHVPVPCVRNGSIALSASAASDVKGKPQYCVAKPDRVVLAGWIERLRGAWALCANEEPRLRASLVRKKESAIDALSGLVEPSLNDPSVMRLSDFQSNLITRFVQDCTGHRILVLRMTTVVRHARSEFVDLLSRWGDIREAVQDAIADLGEAGIRVRSEKMPPSEPAWLICHRCSGRISMSAEDALRLLGDDGTISCQLCTADLAVSKGSGTVLPKVLLEDLLCVTFTHSSLVLTYAGSAEHVLLAQWTCPVALGRPSPIYTWHPRHFLDGPIERAAVSMYLRGRHQEEALQCLHLATSGRDSLIHCLVSSDPHKCGTDWTTHFERHRLSAAMAGGETAALPLAVREALERRGK